MGYGFKRSFYKIKLINIARETKIIDETFVLLKLLWCLRLTSELSADTIEKILIPNVHNHDQKEGTFSLCFSLDLCIALVVCSGKTMVATPFSNLKEALSLEEQARAVILRKKLHGDRTC